MKLIIVVHTEQNPYPRWICAACGFTMNYLTCLEKFGQPPLKATFDVSTYHKGICEVCGKETSVTESRDFFYPNIYKKV